MIGRLFQFLTGCAITGADPVTLEQGNEHPGGAWGEHDTDWTEQEHRYADGKASTIVDGIGYPTIEETTRFYDSYQREDIRIRERE